MIEYRVLGPVEVVVDGAPVELAGQRQRAVLALLLVHANEVVPTGRLVEDLWGEEAPKTATTSLQNTMSQLRRVLGGALVTRSPGYMLRVAPEDVDSARFEQLVRAAHDLEPVARATALRSALDLWRGQPFAELRYEAFVQAETRRLEEVRLAAVEERIAADLELGEHAALIPELEALVSEHPLRERLHEQLMVALYRAGRQGDALQTYLDARRLLADELGLDPNPTLRDLYGRILRQDPALAAANGHGATSSGAVERIDDVVAALVAGRVVPVLGIDADDLASELAERFRYPPSEACEVPRVSQYAAAVAGYGPLYDELNALAARSAEPTRLHRFFASLPPVLRERGVPQQLIVTTSYGDALERAFVDAGEEFDVVSYIATGRNRGRFWHLPPDGSPRVIALPNTYALELSLERRTVILKVRGGVDATFEREWESFVVTEDDYIDYLGRGDVASGVPVSLAATLRRSHFLFLGYTMRDWTLRLVLGRMWGETPVSYRSWAVHEAPGPGEHELWRRVDVELVATPLTAYVEQLAAAVGVPEVAVA